MTDTIQAAAPAATISPDYSAYLAREAERDRLNAELLPANKAALFGTLEAAGIVIVVLTFDGCGDSGQIEFIEAPTRTTTSSLCPTMRLRSPRRLGRHRAGAADAPGPGGDRADGLRLPRTDARRLGGQ